MDIDKRQIIAMLKTAIEEIESGRARGCYLACFGPGDDDIFSISGCAREIRHLLIAEAEELLEDLKAKQQFRH